MPFKIVRNDITNMKADVIVNTANPHPVVGSGCDWSIHKKAGPELLKAREAIGDIAVGQVRDTPAFSLNAKYVFHAVGPIWKDGNHGEERILQKCYENALNLALSLNCTSIAFPLLATGNYGFPKDKALQIAINVFSSFLLKHEMDIVLVVFHKEAFVLSEKVFHSVNTYIDENYVRDKLEYEYNGSDGETPPRFVRKEPEHAREDLNASFAEVLSKPKKIEPFIDQPKDLLDKLDAGFAETLFHLIDKTGMTDIQIYKKANIDRKLFSKIRSDSGYRPSKTTAIAFAMALELNLDETLNFIGRAGHTLSRSNKFDTIIEYFIVNKKYNIIENNAVLFEFDLPLI